MVRVVYPQAVLAKVLFMLDAAIHLVLCLISHVCQYCWDMDARFNSKNRKIKHPDPTNSQYSKLKRPRVEGDRC